jgi:molybdate transport system substrate-binding protein
MRTVTRSIFGKLLIVATFLSAIQTPGCVRPSTPPPQKNLVRVAAASDLQYVFPDLAAAFAKQKPEIRLEPTFGSSGNFFAQLANRAPFDLFLSADMDYPRKLVGEGVGEAKTEFVYAIGRIVLWVPNDSKITLTGFADLLDPSIKKIALANPKNAPYGRIAEAALRKKDVFVQLESKFVFGENIAQTAQFVESGAADMGILAHSLTKSPRMRDKGRSWTIPADAHPKLEQGGVILDWSEDRAAANAFRSFLLSEDGRAVLRQSGFDLP